MDTALIIATILIATAWLGRQIARAAVTEPAPSHHISAQYPLWPESTIRRTQLAYAEAVQRLNDRRDELGPNNTMKLADAFRDAHDRATELEQDLDWMLKTNALVASGQLTRTEGAETYKRNHRDYSALSKKVQEGAKLAGLWKGRSEGDRLGGTPDPEVGVD